MFGLNPVTMWVGIALLATNLFTLTAWRMEVAAHALTKAQDANERVAQAEQAAQRMQEAQVLNDALVASVARKETEIVELKESHRAELRKATMGRPCLSSGAVRLLNAQASGNGDAETGREPVPASTAVASDTDIAEWASDAIAQYETCRTRIDAIREFYNHHRADG